MGVTMIAGGGARTHTILRSLDFESSASASSATPAQRTVKLRSSRRSSSASDEVNRLQTSRRPENFAKNDRVAQSCRGAEKGGDFHVCRRRGSRRCDWHYGRFSTRKLCRLCGRYNRSRINFFAQPFSGCSDWTFVRNDCPPAALFTTNFPWRRRKRSRGRSHRRERSRRNIGSRNNGRWRRDCRRLPERLEKFANPFFVGLHGCARKRSRCRRWRCRCSICLVGTFADFARGFRQQLKQNCNRDEQKEEQIFEMHLVFVTSLNC